MTAEETQQRTATTPGRLESGLGLWSCTRGHIDLIFDGFTKAECGAPFGAGVCHMPGEQVPGWMVVPPEQREEGLRYGRRGVPTHHGDADPAGDALSAGGGHRPSDRPEAATQEVP